MSQPNNWCTEQDEILIDFVRNHEALFNVKSADYRKMQWKQKLWHEVGTILHKTDTECSKRWAYIRDYYIRKRGKPGTRSVGEAAKKRSELLSFLDSCPSGKRRYPCLRFPAYSHALKNSFSTVSNIPHDEEASRGLHEDINQIDTQNLSQTSAIELTSPRYEDDDNLFRDVHSPECSLEEIPNTSSIANTTPQTATLRSTKKRKSTSTSEARLQLLQDIARRPQHPPEHQDETDLYFASMAKIVKKLPKQEQIRIRLEIGTLIGNAELAFYNQTNRNMFYLPSPGPSTSTEESTDYNVTQLV